ncbi:MAG: response regulator transcription factor [Candidatus Omnitrophota bacterium]
MPKKILIVDDEPDIFRGLDYLFTEEGYDVIGASSGKEALKKAREEKPELALLDTKLSDDMDGIELCRQIKQVEKLPTKVIVYTGKIDAIDAVRARENGADDYYVKGSSVEGLLEAVRKLIGA